MATTRFRLWHRVTHGILRCVGDFTRSSRLAHKDMGQGCPSARTILFLALPPRPLFPPTLPPLCTNQPYRVTSLADTHTYSTHHATWPGVASDQAAVIGTILFNFGFVTTVPSWVNEKKASVRRLGTGLSLDGCGALAPCCWMRSHSAAPPEFLSFCRSRSTKWCGCLLFFATPSSLSWAFLAPWPFARYVPVWRLGGGRETESETDRETGREKG